MSARTKPFPVWALLSLATNGVLMLLVVLLLARDRRPSPNSVQARASTTGFSRLEVATAEQTNLGQRHQLTYTQWLSILEQEAAVAVLDRPDRLGVLAGDSLSLWFPPALLPRDRTWLNQGISGETSAGLLDRLSIFDQTQPQVVFVMIGINDLIRGISEETVLANSRLIVRYLQRTHPNAKIVLQSILPHGGEKSSWEGRDRLRQIPNPRIRELNRRLTIVAREEDILYLDLHSLFTNVDGNLRPDFSTDGLHLNSQGYLVWRSALQVFGQLELDR